MEKTRAKLAPGSEPSTGEAAQVRGAASVFPSEPLAILIPEAGGRIAEKHWPKKHAPGSLKRGDSVWYRGDRFWIEYCPPDWGQGCYARLSDKPVHPDPERPLPTDTGRKDLTSFCVHADLLDVAPQAKSLYAAQPTRSAVARAERAAKGERDVGDEVAVLLRSASSLDDVYRIGAEFLGTTDHDLRTKYGHLNPGQQRMNIGNRMRAKWRKDHGK